MSAIKSAKAYANNEVAFVAWSLVGPIPGCLGFEITRIYVTAGDADAPAGTERVLAAWVPFEGQSNKDWVPQTTGVWPVQKLTWRDLTVRQRRDRTELRVSGATLKYRIRPIVPAAPGLTPVANIPPKTYEGAAVPLAYVDPGFVTNEVTITNNFGAISAGFNNGILSTQWLKHAFEARLNKPLTKDNLMPFLSKAGDPFRTYLTGDALGMLRQLLERAQAEAGAQLFMALYELTDEELIDLIVANAPRVHLILSNTSLEKGTKKWDTENDPARKTLHGSGLAEMYDRLFNNSGHIGHNKFVVLVGGDGVAKAVLTGSTNWTPNGLCAQTNNAMIIESGSIAQQYLDYWSDLKSDTDDFTQPDPTSAATKNVQGAVLRAADATQLPSIGLGGNATLTMWRSPNTKTVSKGTTTPPDLAMIYSLMRKAKGAIFFAVFLPSAKGATSIIEEAIKMGQLDPSLLVYGTISSPMAMPNYVSASDAAAADTENGDSSPPEKASPATYDTENVHLVRASALGPGDIIGDFEAELLTAGNAIIHDKILIIDPLDDDCVVVTGSHNLGFKASYANDDNLVIVQGNKAIAQAYTVHVLDLYEHYRFRAVQAEETNKGLKTWQGFLSVDDKWLEPYLSGEKSALSNYLS